jgi:hypothetical protein
MTAALTIGGFSCTSIKIHGTKLQVFMQTFDRSAAEIIRQLIAQASPEDFPQSWHLTVNECLAPPDHVEAQGV